MFPLYWLALSSSPPPLNGPPSPCGALEVGLDPSAPSSRPTTTLPRLLRDPPRLPAVGAVLVLISAQPGKDAVPMEAVVAREEARIRPNLLADAALPLALYPHIHPVQQITGLLHLPVEVLETDKTHTQQRT